MSLVFPSREVAAGPTVGLKGQGTSLAAAAAPTVACVSVPVYLCVAGDEWRVPGTQEGGKAAVGRNGLGLGLGLGGLKGTTGCLVMAEKEEEEEKDAVSSESSSIGAGGDSSLSLSSSADDDRGDGEEEVQSKLRKGALGSLESLEESLPIK